KARFFAAPRQTLGGELRPEWRHVAQEGTCSGCVRRVDRMALSANKQQHRRAEAGRGRAAYSASQHRGGFRKRGGPAGRSDEGPHKCGPYEEAKMASVRGQHTGAEWTAEQLGLPDAVVRFYKEKRPHYPTNKALLVPVLMECQKQLGSISEETQSAVAQLLG